MEDMKFKQIKHTLQWIDDIQELLDLLITLWHKENSISSLYMDQRERWFALNIKWQSHLIPVKRKIQDLEIVWRTRKLSHFAPQNNNNSWTFWIVRLILIKLICKLSPQCTHDVVTTATYIYIHMKNWSTRRNNAFRIKIGKLILLRVLNLHFHSFSLVTIAGALYDRTIFTDHSDYICKEINTNYWWANCKLYI